MSKKKKKKDVEDTINWNKIPHKDLQDRTNKIRHKLMQIERAFVMRSIILDVDIEELEQYVYELRQALPIDEIAAYNRKTLEKHKEGL